MYNLQSGKFKFVTTAFIIFISTQEKDQRFSILLLSHRPGHALQRIASGSKTDDIEYRSEISIITYSRYVYLRFYEANNVLKPRKIL